MIIYTFSNFWAKFHYVSKQNKLRKNQAEHLWNKTINSHLKRKAFLEGVPIISSSDCNGYYISYDRSDIMKVRNQASSRVRKEVETIKACDRILEKIDQLKL